MSKAIHRELCKKLNLDHTNKWSVRENETYKILWDFEIQIDHLISAKRPGLVIVNKKRTSRMVNIAVLADHRVKLKESETRDKYLDLARELKKTMGYESDDDTNCQGCTQYSHQRNSTGTGGLENKNRSGDHPNNSLIKIGQNTEESPGEVRRIAVTQTPVKGFQLMLV